MKCKQHPSYEAKGYPRKTTLHPDGCPTCWGVWEAAKRDPKKLVNEVSLALTLDEARAVVLSLHAVLADPNTARTAASVLRPLMDKLTKMTREAV